MFLTRIKNQTAHHIYDTTAKPSKHSFYFGKLLNERTNSITIQHLVDAATVKTADIPLDYLMDFGYGRKQTRCRCKLCHRTIMHTHTHTGRVCKLQSNHGRITTETRVKNARDGREPEPSKNEPNQNPGFAKNQTKQEPESKKMYKNPK